MKAAAQHKQCNAGGVKTPSGDTRRQSGAHLPRRHAVDPASAAAADDDLRLTIQWNDIAEDEGDQGSLEVTVPRVLLIDSDDETAASLRTLLVPEAKLLHAPNCAEARRLLETQLLSLVIVDPGLPDGDGAMLVRSIAHTPVLVYSAREPVRLDKLPYLPKPFTTPRQLWSTISRMLGIGGLLASED